MTVDRQQLDFALDKQAQVIKEHLDLRLAPLIKDVNGHQKTLYGENGQGGLSADVAKIQTTGGILKWLLGLSGVSWLWTAINTFTGRQ
jgi:hypothetical protein